VSERTCARAFFQQQSKLRADLQTKKSKTCFLYYLPLLATFSSPCLVANINNSIEEEEEAAANHQ
jgi:hypothetical protein